jgi:citrate lyase subunit beta/citryl-CoA lyase
MTAEKNSVIRPRRSVLYMPGANQRALEKARGLAVDALIFDLEDAVAPDAKDLARAQVADAVTQGGYGPREVIVRINALDTPWGQKDLAACLTCAPDAVLLPKVSRPEDMTVVSAALPTQTALWIMVETPQAIFDIAAIAAAGAANGLVCMVMGTNDLLKDMRAGPMDGRQNLHAALSLTVLAARQNGIAVLDGVYNALDDAVGLEAEATQGRDFGFDGKTLIHPNQVEIANRVFAPSAPEYAQAQAVVAAFEAPENAGKGVLQVNGKMVELLHYQTARRTLALVAAIEAREGT